MAKRSTNGDPIALYHNDYLDSADSPADYPEDEDYGERGGSHVGDETSNWWLFGRKKHKKHHRKHNRRHKYRFWKKRHDKIHPDDKPAGLSSGGDPNDFNDIKNRIRPNQQEDIDKFIRNVNSGPQVFDFDVDAFVANNRKRVAESDGVAAAVVPRGIPPERSFYQFRPESALVDKTNDRISLPNRSANPSIEIRARRDILTQHLKAIANKIHLYPATADDPFRWTYLPNIVAPPNKRVQSNGNSGDEEDNHFIDNYYLLNDGNKPADPMPKHKSASALADLDMDLELERKFRDLNTSKDSAFYSAEVADDFAKQKQP